MSRDTARRAVQRAITGRQQTNDRFAADAKIDVGTLGDFLAGKRWPHSITRAKIEKALGWPVGRIADLAEGSEPVEGVLAAIEQDDRLLPEAKAHLMNQYELLLRIQGTPRPSPEALNDKRERTSLAKLSQHVGIVPPVAGTPRRRRK